MELNEKEQKKYEVIEKLVNNVITKEDAVNQLGICKRQINRLIKLYNEQGKEGFVHKNRGKVNLNKKPSSLLNELEELYLKEYYDYNFEAFYEVIKDKYNISRSVMHNEFLKDNIISPLAHKKTVKSYNETMENAIAKTKEGNKDNELLGDTLKLYETRKLEQEKAFVRRSSNFYSFGQEVQMDACFKIWFGGVSSALHLAVDKATKKVLFGWFEPEETTRGYFVVLFHILLNYGIPYKIKTDNRTTFSTNKKNNKAKLDKTQFGKICEYLGIILETTSNATSKANVERENKTFKDRLIAELRHEGVDKIDEANEYLNNKFIPRMNTLFSYDINEKTSMMKENNYTNEELNLIISERCKRIIDNASSISFNGKYYVPISEDGEIMTFKHKTECIVIVAYDGSYWCEIENNYYRLHIIITREKIVQPKENKSLDEAPKLKYKPPADHPWRKSMGKFFNKT